MYRKEFLQSILAILTMGTLSSFKNFTDNLPLQNKKLPVLFTSHGSPMDIVAPKEERPFWNTLFELGTKHRLNYFLHLDLPSL